jgi:tape measure domain-containing protein
VSANASIVISAKDNYSSAIKKMQATQTSFRKDLKSLQKELDTLNKNKLTLNMDLSKAKRELKDAEKAFGAVGDEAARLRLEAAQADYDNIRQNLDLVSRTAKQTARDMDNLTGVVSKSENRMGGAGGTLATLAKAGLFSMAGNAAADLGGVLASSAFGGPTGDAITSVLGGAASGAAMGSVAGPAGTAIGAAVGALTGAVQAFTAQYSSKDDAFKSVVQDTYNEIKQAQAESLSSGSEIAASRETAQISFTTLFGDADVAQDFLSDVTDFANVTPFLFDDLTAMSKVLKTYGYTVEELLPTMQKIGDAGAALGMGQEDMAAIATYLGRMKTTGKATLEYLTPLLERGIPVWDYLAQASGIAKDEVQEMVTRGLVPGAKAAEIIADYMGDDFAGSMEQQSQTYAGLASTMQGMQDEMNNALGEGYNEQRKLGMQEQIEWLSGESGEAMKEANRLIGEWQASLENEKERLLRESMDAVMTSDAFAEADSVEKGRMLAAAQAEANAEYLKSDGYQLQQEANEKLVDDIQVAMKDVYLDAGYNMGLKFSEGVANAIKDAGGGVASVIAAELGGGYSGVSPRMEHERGYAYGIQRVPYDNFPALLHEGERVLTASQAREQGGAPTVQVTGNSFIVREEADIDRIATALCQKIADAQAAYVGEVRIA